MKLPWAPLKAVFLGAFLAGCATPDRESKSAAEDPGAMMREMRSQTINQMKTAGASASQIREMQRQFDVMEKQMRQMQKQMEKLEHDSN